MINKQSLRILYRNGMYKVRYQGKDVCQSFSRALAERKARYLLKDVCICQEGKAK